MNILVTGGAGFIGSNFIKYMIEKYPYYYFVNLDNLTYAANEKNLSSITNSNYTFIKGDINDSETLSKIFNKDIDIVVNFAAESHVDRSIKNPSSFITTNINGTQRLLDFSYKNGVKKFIQISTDEVYGALGEKGLFSENSPLAPNSPYSASKASADLLVNAYSATYGLPINITRCSNNYGPHQHPEKLIPMTIMKAYGNEQIPMYGDGRNVRDWIHVMDHCSAIDLVIHKGVTGETYNVGTSNEKENIELVKQILKLMHRDENLITFVKDRLGHDKRYGVDATKIQRELGWMSKYNFDEELRDTIDWYVNNLF